MQKTVKVPTGAEHKFVLNRVTLRFDTAVDEEVMLRFSSEVVQEPELVFSTEVVEAPDAS